MSVHVSITLTYMYITPLLNIYYIPIMYHKHCFIISFDQHTALR